jgi:hypothetical protein
MGRVLKNQALAAHVLNWCLPGVFPGSAFLASFGRGTQAHRAAPVTTISISRLPQREQTSRACHSGKVIPAP